MNYTENDRCPTVISTSDMAAPGVTSFLILQCLVGKTRLVISDWSSDTGNVSSSDGRQLVEQLDPQRETELQGVQLRHLELDDDKTVDSEEEMKLDEETELRAELLGDDASNEDVSISVCSELEGSEAQVSEEEGSDIDCFTCLQGLPTGL